MSTASPLRGRATAATQPSPAVSGKAGTPDVQRCVERWQAIRPDRQDIDAWGVWLIGMAHDLDRIDKKRRSVS